MKRGNEKFEYNAEKIGSWDSTREGFGRKDKEFHLQYAELELVLDIQEQISDKELQMQELKGEEQFIIFARKMSETGIHNFFHMW